MVYISYKTKLKTFYGGKIMKKVIDFKSLRKFNVFMGFLHLIQGSAMLIFALTIDQIKNFRTPVWSNYLNFDTVTRDWFLFPRNYLLYLLLY